jgi:curli biogenesis system outer membrane secretion channel CsgG
MSRRPACLLVAPVLLSLGAGCSSFFEEVSQSPFAKEVHRSLSLDGTETIHLAVLDPQSAGVAQVRSLAVLEFTGAAKVGEALSAAVAARLATLNRFEIKDRQTVQRAATEVTTAGESAFQVGAKVGADAVLIGEISALQQADSGAATPSSVGALNYANKEVHTRQAMMTVDYRVLDSKTGKVLLTRRATPSAALRSLNAANGLEPAPDAAQAMQKMLTQAAEQIAAELAAPGKRTVERKFARAGGRVNSGNTYARQGVLDIAQQTYQQATDEDAKNHAAWYNLGLILEAQGDYAGACQHFERAMKLRESELYIGAFQRARTAGGVEVAAAR